MDELYHELILDLYKHPLNKKRLDDFTLLHREHNPACGDWFDIYIKLDAAGTIAAIGYEGDGCAVSQAAASLVSEKVKRKNSEYVAGLQAAQVLDMLGLPHLNPTRMRCALLMLSGLKKTLAEKYYAPAD